MAVDSRGQAIGAVGLGQFDIEERRDRFPWVLGMIVAASYRGIGIGSTLMEALKTWAQHQGYSQTWVATGKQHLSTKNMAGNLLRVSIVLPEK